VNSTLVFKHRNQDIVRIFERAGNPAKVACVIFDYAKASHLAFVCDGEGRNLKDTFEVENSTAGVDFVCQQIAKTCNRFAIHPANVVIGGEDCGSFSHNFVAALARKGYLVIGVHAHAAKLLRENFQASTDKLDLLGIAKMILDRRGTTRSDPPGNHRRLREITRHRADLVTMRTAVGNRIHGLVDRVFPGFLDERKSGIPPFSESSLKLMQDRFSPEHLRRRALKTLVRDLESLGVPEAAARAERLRALAESVLACPDELTGVLQNALAHEARLYADLGACIEQADLEAAKILATVPAAMLTTIRGTGITLASGVGSEVGPPASQTSLRRLTSYAGIVPGVKQTGGPEKEPRHGRVRRRCNRVLKNYIGQCGTHMGLHGPDDLREDHRRRTANKQHADFGLARRYLRVAMCLMRSHQAYLPPHLRRNADTEELRAYYLQLWPVLRKKWLKAGALAEAFAPENPLGAWRLAIQEFYGISLPL
jgi:transposase